LRVWSTDWFDNPALQTARLVEKLEHLRTRPTDEYKSYSFGTNTPEQRLEESLGSESLIGTEFEVASSGEAVDALPIRSIFDAEGPIGEAECFLALRQFRDQVIAPEMSDWEPHRSILRDAMIETFIRQRLAEADDWFDRVPGYLRQGTSPAEKRRYLDRICMIVSRISSPARQDNNTSELTDSSLSPMS
jgi:hypothetical protein